MLIPLTASSVEHLFPKMWHPRARYAGIVKHGEIFGIAGLLIVTKTFSLLSYLTLPDKRSSGWHTKETVTEILEWPQSLGLNVGVWTENFKLSRLLQRFGARLVWATDTLHLLIKEN